MDTKNLSIIRQSFAQAVFTHKVQEVAAECSESKSAFVKIINIILATSSLVSLAIFAYYPDQNNFFLAGNIIGIAEISFLIFQLFFNFDQQAAAHKNSALKYLQLRDCYRILIADLMNGNLENNVLVARRNSLQDQYQIISDLAPQTSSQHYEKAQKKLNRKGVIDGEEFTWSDKEIDRFLPEELRIKNQKL